MVSRQDGLLISPSVVEVWDKVRKNRRDGALPMGSDSGP